MAEWNPPHYAALAMKHYSCTSRRFGLTDTLRAVWAAVCLGGKPPIRAGHLVLLLPHRLLFSLVPAAMQLLTFAAPCRCQLVIARSVSARLGGLRSWWRSSDPCPS